MWSYQLGEVEGGPEFRSHSEALDHLQGGGIAVNPELTVAAVACVTDSSGTNWVVGRFNW